MGNNGDGKVLGLSGATIIEGDDNIRARKCLSIIQNTLRMYRCVAMPVVLIEGSLINSTVRVVAVPDEKVPEKVVEH